MAYARVNADGTTTVIDYSGTGTRVTGYKVDFSQNGKRVSKTGFSTFDQANSWAKRLRLGSNPAIIPIYVAIVPPYAQ